MEKERQRNRERKEIEKWRKKEPDKSNRKKKMEKEETEKWNKSG